MPDGGDALARLVEAGFLRREDGGRVRSAARWQAALARAAFRLQRAGAPWDLRLPIAAALVESFPELPDETIAALVEQMLRVEEAELPPEVARGA
jgi:hypothetical protein